MMAYKHLHELLKEDQEPFQLNNYISDKRCQLKRVNNLDTALPVKKRKPIIAETPSAPRKQSFCKHACFLSFQESPDVRKSPFFDLPSPAQKSPSVLLHVPAKTAALLFEAAMRVQTQKHSRGKTEFRSSGFGFLGSILKKLKDRNKSRKKEIGDLIVEEEKCVDEEMGFSRYCNNSRVSSEGWSESNGEKSLDMESSCSSRSEDSLEEAFAAYEKRFCSTTLSPFRFSLHRSHSGQRTPDFSSPAASPQNHKEQEQTEGSNIVLEDEKEQCSPVSVLETLFEVDDDDGQYCGDKDDYEDEDEDDYYYDSDNECNGSYAIVQKAKEQLLDKLRRFEQLAALDPIELEKRMMEEMEEGEYQDDEPATLLGREIDNLDTPMLTEVLKQARFQQSWKVQEHMERLVSDLISEEKKETNGFNGKEVMARRICQKLNSWREVKPHTIDMMVQLDFGREYDSWKKYQEQSGEVAGEIEGAIFRLLVDELAEELYY